MEVASEWGCTPEDYLGSDEPIGVWPDNWDAVNLFVAMLTQWRMGFSGRTGLDYGVVPTVLRLLGIARSSWPDLFQDLRVMEQAALTQMRVKQ